MNCPQCATPVAGDAMFCPKCGQRIAPAEADANIQPIDRLKKSMSKSDNPVNPSSSWEAEQKLWHGGYSPKAMLGGWLLSLLVTIIACIAAIFVPLGGAQWLVAGVVSIAVWVGHLGLLIYRRYGFEYELTNQRFITKTGVFARVTDRVEVIDIDDVQVTQSFTERMVNVGKIRLLSSDVTTPVVTLVGIDDANRVATLIDDARRAERRKRGLHIETI